MTEEEQDEITYEINKDINEYIRNKIDFLVKNKDINSEIWNVIMNVGINFAAIIIKNISDNFTSHKGKNHVIDMTKKAFIKTLEAKLSKSYDN